jgi:hypothetical protein
MASQRWAVSLFGPLHVQHLVVAHGSITAHVAKGDISPSEGHWVASLLDLRPRAVESIELEERLVAIEALRVRERRPGLRPISKRDMQQPVCWVLDSPETRKAGDEQR